MAQPLIVVLDANVYLDVAELTGEPFTWAALQAISAREMKVLPPHPDPRVDAVRAVALAASGSLTSSKPLQLWTSDHIDALVRRKAGQPRYSHVAPEDRGLGWSPDGADALVTDLVWEAVTRSGGDTAGRLDIPRASPPLEHEDGLVYAAGREAANGDALCDRIVVTRDAGFLATVAAPPSYPRGIHTSNFVAFVRASRASEVMGRVNRPRQQTLRSH